MAADTEADASTNTEADAAPDAAPHTEADAAADGPSADATALVAPDAGACAEIVVVIGTPTHRLIPTQIASDRAPDAAA